MQQTDDMTTERALDTSVRVVEVGPRDGLQNAPEVLAAGDTVELVERLVATGISAVEVTSFVRPDRIPQLSDAASVFPAVHKVPGVRYIALVPNRTGLAAAREAGVEEMAVFAAASEQFSQSNLGRGIDDSLAMFADVAAEGRALGMRVRGYVSTVLGCPFAGHVPLDDVVRVVEAMDAMGCDEISLGDTIGVGTPPAAVDMVERVATSVSIDRLAVHFHDTYGMGLANSLAAIQAGVRVVDTSIVGLGGCPFAGKGATGNLATEDLVYALDGSDTPTGIDLVGLLEVNAWLAGRLGRSLPSRAASALLARSAS
ncbi:hydroxymethylglutaryl-CoA lyase [soil metagenome]